MAIKTHYDNLKVPRTASKVEIKRAYRKLCSLHHPDKFPEEKKAYQNKILVIINKSYAVLSNDIERRKHDEWIAHAELLERQKKNTQTKSQPQRNAYTHKEREFKTEAKARWDRDRAKEKKEDKAVLRKKRKDQFITVALVIGLFFILVWALTDDDEPQFQKFKASELTLVLTEQSRVQDTLVFDWYYNISSEKFDSQGTMKELRGELKYYTICQRPISSNIHKVQMVYHLLKDKQRIYMTTTLDHVCGK